LKAAIEDSRKQQNPAPAARGSAEVHDKGCNSARMIAPGRDAASDHLMPTTLSRITS
jgi:hypothetical protein